MEETLFTDDSQLCVSFAPFPYQFCLSIHEQHEHRCSNLRVAAGKDLMGQDLLLSRAGIRCKLSIDGRIGKRVMSPASKSCRLGICCLKIGYTIQWYTSIYPKIKWCILIFPIEHPDKLRSTTHGFNRRRPASLLPVPVGLKVS